MAPSSFTWLQFDAEQSRRARELVRALSEPTSLDSIGIGTIRDGFANLFFPGTSTIQTRARYFLLVPWAMQHVADARPRNRDQYDRRLRDAEVATIDALKVGDPKVTGIIGVERGHNIQTLPSAIYWSGTAAWGIRVAGHLSRSDLRDLAVAHRETHRSDDGQAAPFVVWDDLPARPATFPDGPLAILPTPEEADYLLAKMAQTRITTPASVADPNHAEPTLLAQVALKPHTAIAAHVWDLPPNVLTPYLANLVDLARGFALVIQGARLRYLDLLFERKTNTTILVPPNRETVDELLAGWRDQMQAEGATAHAWVERLPEMFAILAQQGVTLRATTRDFVSSWSAAAVKNPSDALKSNHLAELIRDRENLLKGSAARLSYDSPLLAWNGELLGAEPLDFRWGITRRHIQDCIDGKETTDAQS